MEKWVFRMCGLLLALCVCVSSAWAEGDVTVTLKYQRDGYPDTQLTMCAGERLSSGVLANAFDGIGKYVYGTDFDGWYLDSDCRQPLTRKEKAENDITLYGHWVAWDEERTCMMDAWLAQMDSAKLLLNYKPMYTTESFEYYMDQLFKQWGSTANASWEDVERLKTLQASLVQVKKKDDVIWDIWGENIPQENTDEYSFYLLQDTKDFRPCLTAFLLDDQEKVKGNIIICSGGGYTYRGNDGEGYPTAAHMNALGYNCFVLQYRLRPYATIDSYLDLQRAIRYLRYHAERKNIGAIEHIATIGFSAGGFVVCGQATQCYGDILPTAFYPDYLCDDVDRMDSNVAVAAPIYGLDTDAWMETENQNLPALFLAVGTLDGMCQGYTEGFLKVLQRTFAELHVYDGVPHGFGMSDNFAGADQMAQQFDAFLQVHFDLTTRTNH